MDGFLILPTLLKTHVTDNIIKLMLPNVTESIFGLSPRCHLIRATKLSLVIN